ncbi:VCBS repeat-containing protein [Glycomyces sp. NPDC047369]
MQRFSSRRRRLHVMRLAALAAGAAIIAAPGVAAAQVTDPTADTVEPAAADASRDYTGDGVDDLLTLRRNGRLILHAGNGDGTFDPGTSIGTGWGGYDMAAAGDLTGDGLPDIVARENATGTLFTYPGNGTGGFGQRVFVGYGWGSMGMFAAGGDFDGDGTADLLAVRESDGELFFYPGLGDGTFGARSSVGSSWHERDVLTVLGDVDANGCDDILGRDRGTGWYTVLLGDCTTGFGAEVPVDGGLVARSGGHASDVSGGGDYNGDGLPDVLAVDGRSGELSLSTLTDDSTPVVDAVGLGAGWSDERLPSVPGVGEYDFGIDGRTDLYAVRSSDGALFYYPGNGSGGFGSAVQVGTGWAGLTLVETAGDIDEDGHQDVLARSADGILWFFRGTGVNGGLTGPVRIGSGWNSFDAIVSGHDVNGDGWTDIVARSTETHWMFVYAGRGDGTFKTALQYGTGWDVLREITLAGDLTGDGTPDIVAINKGDECLYLYRGNTSGSVSQAVKVGCGWEGVNAIAAVGDFNGDGKNDIVARRDSDGNLFLYRGNANGNFLTSVRIGTGWNTLSTIV